jgi:hypothetical protein
VEFGLEHKQFGKPVHAPKVICPDKYPQATDNEFTKPPFKLN